MRLFLHKEQAPKKTIFLPLAAEAGKRYSLGVHLWVPTVGMGSSLPRSVHKPLPLVPCGWSAWKGTAGKAATLHFVLHSTFSLPAFLQSKNDDALKVEGTQEMKTP